MDSSSPITSSGAAATYLAQAASAAAQASALESAPAAKPPEASSGSDCDSCKVDARSRPLLDSHSQLAAQEAASQSRHLERLAAEASAKTEQRGLEDRQPELQRPATPEASNTGETGPRAGIIV
jgi:hypothetical protein